MTVFRPRLGLIATRISIAIIVIGTLYGVWRHPGGEAFTSIWLIAVPLLSVAACLILFLMGRPMVVATDSELYVRNLIRSHHLSWPQVVSVRFGRDAPWVTLDLSDGTTLPVLAIAASDGERARRAASHLATLVERYSA